VTPSVVDLVLQDSGAPWRSQAPGEWGLSLPDVDGWPLDIGLRLTGTVPELLRIQAEACGPAGAPDPHWLLHRNRLGELVRYTHSSAGAVWVQAEVPAAALSAELLERVLVLVVEAAAAARAAGAARAAAAPARGPRR